MSLRDDARLIAGIIDRETGATSKRRDAAIRLFDALATSMDIDAVDAAREGLEVLEGKGCAGRVNQ